MYVCMCVCMQARLCAWDILVLGWLFHFWVHTAATSPLQYLPRVALLNLHPSLFPLFHSTLFTFQFASFAFNNIHLVRIQPTFPAPSSYPPVGALCQNTQARVPKPFSLHPSYKCEFAKHIIRILYNRMNTSLSMSEIHTHHVVAVERA